MYILFFPYICVLNYKTAETILQLTGDYWDSLRKLGLPNYLKFNGELVVIVGKIYKRRSQCYYVMESGKEKHASFFFKLTKEDLRDIKLNKLLDGNGN